MRRPTLRLSLVCATAVLLLGALVLFVPAPRPVLAFIVEKSSGWLLEENGGGALKGLVRIYVQSALASHMADQILEQPGTDEEILLRMMLAVRRSVVSARPAWQSAHSPAGWPVLIAGIGYCDQINGAVATVGAQYFPKAELVGLYRPETLVSPHTIGRVWSEQRGRWLYFDAFYRQPVIFIRDPQGQIHFVETSATLPPSKREVAPPGTYDLAGWKLAEFPGSFPEYLASRVRDRVMPAPAPGLQLRPAPAPPEPDLAETEPAPNVEDPSTASESALAPQVAAAAPPAAGPDAAPAPAARPTQMLASRPALREYAPSRRRPKVDDDLYRRIVAAYAKARVQHLLGTPDRDAYRLIAGDTTVTRDDRASELAYTARRFVERPDL